ncbi:Putative AC9 transposase [Linum perenne]
MASNAATPQPTPPQEDAPITNEASNAVPVEESASAASGSGGIQSKKRQLRSPHWEGFTAIYCMEGNPPREVRYGKCNRCEAIIKANSSNSGTNGLKNHHESCERKFKDLQTQPKLSYQVKKDGVVSKEDWVFNAEEVRLALAEMIILDELPFRFVERLGFTRFMARCCSMFEIPGRRAIRDDCARLFLERKDSLKSLFHSKGMGRISVTTDCWTNLRNQNFICVTAHFIGRNWQLHKKIIAFRMIVSHKGEDVADSVMDVLSEWDIRSLMCCTVDNASTNDVAIRHMRERLQLWGGEHSWREVDMPTRWNATYTMLEHAEPYENAFRCYESMVPSFVTDLNKVLHAGVVVGPPGPNDWIKVRWMMEYLKKFYDLTCLVSGTSAYPPRPPRSEGGASEGSSATGAGKRKATNELKRRSGRGSLSSLRSESDEEENHSDISELSVCESMIAVMLLLYCCFCCLEFELCVLLQCCCNAAAMLLLCCCNAAAMLSDY